MGNQTVEITRPVPLIVHLAQLVRSLDLQPDERHDIAVRMAMLLEHEVHGFGPAMRRNFLEAAS